MVLANRDTWDRYAAAQWWTLDQWLRANSDDPDAPMIRETFVNARREFLEYERPYFGWGVFVLRAA